MKDFLRQNGILLLVAAVLLLVAGILLGARFLKRRLEGRDAAARELNDRLKTETEPDDGQN